MAERKYTYRVEIDTGSLAAAEAEIRRRLGGAMAEIQSQPQTQRATQTTLAEFEKLEAELKKIGQIDLTAPVDKLQESLAGMREEVRRLDAEIRDADIRRSSMSAMERAKRETYWDELAKTQGEDAAALARGRGVVGSIGQITAEFPDDQRPVSEFTQRAYAEVEEVHRLSREQTRQLMEQEARLYAIQQAEAQAELAIIRQRIAQYEAQMINYDAGSEAALMAFNEAHIEQERLAAAEIEAANSLAAIKKRLREEMEQDAAAARKAALQSGDLSAAGAGGASRLTVSVTQNTATQAAKLADELERAAKMEERIAASVREQNQHAAARNDNELKSIRAKTEEAQAAEKLLEIERSAGAAERAEIQKAVAAHAEGEKRQTAIARAEANERAAIARQEGAIRVEEAREARIRATEEERRQTAAYRAELSQRQRVATQSRGGGLLAGIGREIGGFAGGALSVYGAIEATRTTYEMGRLGAANLQLARSFDALSEKAGLTGDVLRGKLRDAVQVTVADTRLAAETNLLLAAAQQQNIRITEDEIAKLAQLARLRSTQLTANGRPISTEEAYGRLIRGTVKRETELLDELGLSTKQLADVMGVSVKEVNSSVDSLLASLLKVADIEIAKFGEPIEDEMTRILQAETRFTNAMDRLRAELAGPVGFAAPTGAGIFDLWVSNEIGKLNTYKEMTAGVSDLLEAQRLWSDRLQEDDAVVRAYADHIGYLSGQLATGQISWDEYVAAIRQTLTWLSQYEQASGEAIVATDTMAGAVFNLADAIQRVTDLGIPDVIAGGLVTRFSPSYGPDGVGDMGSGQRDFDSNLENLRRRSTATREAAGAQAAMVADIHERFVKAIEKQENEQKRAAEKAGREWERAADKARSAFEGAVGSIPGIGSPSEVTDQDMQLAEHGLYRPKADEFLRQAEDELRNGVDYDRVRREDIERMVAQSGGFDQGALGAIPGDLLADLFREEWSSKRLFADPSNLDLIDLGAVRGEMEAQRQGEAGQQNILNLLRGAGLGEAYGIDAAGQFAQNLAGAIPGEFAAVDIAGPAGTALVEQFSSPAALAQFKEVGKATAAGIFQGYEGAIAEAPFAASLVNAITAAVMGQLLSTFGQQRP